MKSLGNQIGILKIHVEKTRVEAESIGMSDPFWMLKSCLVQRSKPLFLAGETTIVYIYIRVNYHSQIIRVN